MDIVEKDGGIDLMLGHQPGQRGAVRMEIALLDAECLFAVHAQQVADEGGHALVDMREQIGARRIERIVQIEDPGVDMGKSGSIAASV